MKVLQMFGCRIGLLCKMVKTSIYLTNHLFSAGIITTWITLEHKVGTILSTIFENCNDTVREGLTI